MIRWSTEVRFVHSEQKCLEITDLCGAGVLR